MFVISVPLRDWMVGGLRPGSEASRKPLMSLRVSHAGPTVLALPGSLHPLPRTIRLLMKLLLIRLRFH